MKTTTLVLAGMILSATTTTRAQYAVIGSQPAPGVFVGYASTAEEGYLRGLADLQRAQGAWMLNASQAMVNCEEARRRSTENHAANVKAFFQLREENRRAREVERSHANANAPLAPQPAMKVNPAARAAVNLIRGGQIAWHEALKSESIASSRAQLEALYAQRKAGHELKPAEREELNQIRTTMLNELKQRIPELTSRDYFAALQFVKSLTSLLAAVDFPERLAGR